MVCVVGKRNEYSTKSIQIMALQPNCVSTLPD